MRLVHHHGDDVVNDVDLFFEHPDAYIWHIDLMVKYYEAGWSTHSDDGITVTFRPSERSEGLGHTQVVVFELEEIDGDPWDWQVLTEGGRYMVRVAAYRRLDKPEPAPVEAIPPEELDALCDQIWGAGNWVACPDCPRDATGALSRHHVNFHR